MTYEWVWCCEDCGKPWPLPGDPPIFAECDHCGGPLNAPRSEAFRLVPIEEEP